MSESEESINHLEEIKTIANSQKQYTAVVRIYGIKKDFVIETGTSVTKMPPDEQMMGKTETLKITNRYQEVNKNEVMFRWKIPVNIENNQSENQNVRKISEFV